MIPLLFQGLCIGRYVIKHHQDIVESHEWQVPLKGSAVVSAFALRGEDVEVRTIAISLIDEWHVVSVRLNRQPRLNLIHHVCVMCRKDSMNQEVCMSVYGCGYTLRYLRALFSHRLTSSLTGLPIYTVDSSCTNLLSLHTRDCIHLPLGNFWYATRSHPLFKNFFSLLPNFWNGQESSFAFVAGRVALIGPMLAMPRLSSACK